MRKTHLLLVGLLLSFTLNATNDIPRPEYPRPQFERSEWVNLNGTWSYELDLSNSGKSRNLTNTKSFSKTITVPFCPESKLSGVNHTDFIHQMWYQRSLNIPAGWKGKNILLNFGAVDYYTEIYLDGFKVGSHFGGNSSFSVDLTSRVKPGQTHNLVLYVVDTPRTGIQTVGKQSPQSASFSCFYSRTTGIWQTVWMEAVSKNGLKSVDTRPDIDAKQLVITPEFYQPTNDGTLEVTLYDQDQLVAQKTTPCNNGSSLTIPVKKMKLWSPETPHLYDITYRVKNSKGEVMDEVKSYVGMRKVHTVDGKVYLNNEPYFQRLVLNQGYYADGIWTAPNDEALKNDILLSKAAGFNGARLHQKAFEERFHYWADKLGFITWGESPNWGMNLASDAASRYFISEWTEIITRDRNHPSIITWVPFNQPNTDRLPDPYLCLVEDVYRLTKAIDPTRPVNNNAGGSVKLTTDICSPRNYESDPALFTSYSKTIQMTDNDHPFLIGEFGGIGWIESTARDGSWGYGGMLTNEEGFYNRLEGLVNSIEANGNIAGFCYTQLTDIEQEKNGIYYYDRRPKLDMNRIKAIFEKIPSRPAEKK